MKKLICSLLVAALLLPSLLCGCQSIARDNGKLTIVATTFPAYDWIQNILGDRAADNDVELILMLDSGADMHSYQPTFDDRIAITSCDLLVYVGGADDAWIEEALADASVKPATVSLMDALGDKVKKEAALVGAEHDHEDGEACTDETHRHPEGADDEHVWLSLRHAATLCDIIAMELAALDAEHGMTYQSNAEDYVGKLNALDNRYTAMTQSAKRSTVLFGDRFPFRYLLDDYNVHYFAAFSGCSSDTNASFETVAYLAEQMDELGLPCVLTVDDATGNIAASIIANTRSKDQQILSMDAMQSVSSKDVSNGATYLSIMEKNLDVLTSALN